MKQLTQKLKNGKMQILEVPVPSLQKGQILVKNYYSLISAGTEGSTVTAARKGYIGKAMERPQQAKQVIDTIKTQGVTQTYRAVMKKLDAYSPLGYSCVGEVIEVAPDINSFQVGDLAACGGLTASHTEVVAVPINLCVKIPSDMNLKQAAYNTLGAIALQGIRQADLRLGETCAVIGLGLLGQLACLLLRASGIRVIGIDVNQAMVEMAAKRSADLAMSRDESGIENKISQFTEGIGCDAVIITAASSSLDPINFAGAISRKRGTVVVVGAVPTGFDREPHFYKKELQVKMSCSYGPGRYDPNYEDKGLDYPPAYVRWTEKRNMHAFQDIINSGKIDVSYLTTHTFKLDEAPAAYDLIMSKSEPFIGILIEYDPQITQITQSKIEIKARTSAISNEPSAVNIGFIGAGSYAQSHLLPNISKKGDVSLKGVMSTTGTGSRSVAERFGFEFCTGNERDILENEDINTIFIATRHDSHADYVIKALKAGKHVFVEKPLCLTVQELEEISELLAQGSPVESVSHSTGQAKLKAESKNNENKDQPDETNQPFNYSTNQLILMVGYNRRFSPLTQMIKDKFGDGLMAMVYRINAGGITSDSWIQDNEIGGGRIIGEVCHFIDYLTFINGSLPVSVYATAMADTDNLNDVINISLSYKNGSIGNISYFANGDKSLAKEQVEIYANGNTVVLNDFKTLVIHANGKKKEKKLLTQDKGQKTEVKKFIETIINGGVEVIPFWEIHNASLVSFKIIESIHTGEHVKI